jgi:Fur family ferric uptake transcriptional regulator
MPLSALPKPSTDLPAAQPPLEIIEPLCAVFRRTLKGEGLKYTPERAQILDTVLRFDRLFHADELQAELRNAGFRVSKATVYRTIKLLQQAGIIQRLLFDEDQAHYQLVYGRKPCDLIIRIDTREVIEVEVPELRELRDALAKARGLKASSHRFIIFAEAN